MLTFNLNEAPPTAEQIAEEKQWLEGNLARCKRRTRTTLTLAYVFAGAVYWLSWWVGVLSLESHGIVFISIAIQCYVLSISGLLALGRQIMWALPSIPLAVCAGAFTGGKLGFGVSILGGIFLPVAITCFFIRYYESPSGQEEQLARLSPLSDPENQSQCDGFIRDCLADPLCETYRQAIAAKGRKAVMVEVDLVRTRAAETMDRLTDEELLRQREIACALAGQPEPLTTEMLSLVGQKESSC